MDFADSASDTEMLFLDLAIRQHAQRCQRPEPLPLCSHCETNARHVTKNGVSLAYCTRCALELGYEAVADY